MAATKIGGDSASVTIGERVCMECGVTLQRPKNWTRISIWKRERPVQCRSCQSRKHGMSRTRVYKVWASMLVRCGHRACTNPDAIKYYIEKGIEVCAEWQDFPVFAEWALANGYADDLTIDRIDSDKNYEPGNSRWVSMTENLRSRADRRFTMDDAREIRRLRASGVPAAKIAAIYEVKRGYIYRICGGHRWAE